mmetsp:Transcript_41797/g.75881  ORF Transcript_41797/g.75881 Transcript_41797/m.75881 type:complete len:597 (+) Transcript_41797:67-1857(+)
MAQAAPPPPGAKRIHAETTPSNYQSARKKVEELKIEWRRRRAASPDIQSFQHEQLDTYWAKVQRSLRAALTCRYDREAAMEERVLVSFRGNKRRKKVAVDVWVGDDRYKRTEAWRIPSTGLYVGSQLPCGEDDALGLSRQSRCDIVFCRTESNEDAEKKGSVIVSPVAMIELKLGGEGPGVSDRDDCTLGSEDGPICQQVMYMLNTVARNARWLGRKGPLQTAVITGLKHGSGRKLECSTSVHFSLVAPDAAGEAWALDCHDQFTCDRADMVNKYVEKCAATMLAVIYYALQMSDIEWLAHMPLGMLGSIAGAKLVAAPHYQTAMTISQGELHEIVDLAAFLKQVEGWVQKGCCDINTDKGCKHVKQGDLVKVVASFYKPLVSTSPATLFRALGTILDEATLRCAISLDAHASVCLVVMPRHASTVDPRRVMTDKTDRGVFLDNIYRDIFIKLLEKSIVYLDMRPSLRNVCRDASGFKLVDLDSFCKGEPGIQSTLKHVRADGRYPPPSFGLPAILIVQLLHIHFCASRGVTEAVLSGAGKELWQESASSELRKKFDDYVAELKLGKVVQKVRAEPAQKCTVKDLEEVMQCLRELP